MDFQKRVGTVFSPGGQLCIKTIGLKPDAGLYKGDVIGPYTTPWEVGGVVYRL